jgi:hypothetical protein
MDQQQQQQQQQQPPPPPYPDCCPQQPNWQWQQQWRQQCYTITDQSVQPPTLWPLSALAPTRITSSPSPPAAAPLINVSSSSASTSASNACATTLLSDHDQTVLVQSLLAELLEDDDPEQEQRQQQQQQQQRQPTPQPVIFNLDRVILQVQDDISQAEQAVAIFQERQTQQVRVCLSQAGLNQRLRKFLNAARKADAANYLDQELAVQKALQGYEAHLQRLREEGAKQTADSNGKMTQRFISLCIEVKQKRTHFCTFKTSRFIFSFSPATV